MLQISNFKKQVVLLFLSVILFTLTSRGSGCFPFNDLQPVRQLTTFYNDDDDDDDNLEPNDWMQEFYNHYYLYLLLDTPLGAFMDRDTFIRIMLETFGEASIDTIISLYSIPSLYSLNTNATLPSTSTIEQPPVGQPTREELAQKLHQKINQKKLQREGYVPSESSNQPSPRPQPSPKHPSKYSKKERKNRKK